MKPILLALLLSLCLCGSAIAQNTYSVKGVVADTANNSKLSMASLSILNAKDSTLYKFTRADATGKFSMNNLRKGNFILLLTYPAYADFVSSFSLDSTKTTLDFGQINMKTKARLLNEVIVKGQAAAIKIKGDTTEFNAASYTIQPNDKVEDLLKKLPGIQVDKDGKITAQGKTVPKVLVDGEEFFGDDPTLVTKNLRADMVDKVQLFEKTSDQAAFTGVDDGQKTQTINIKLKEDKKNGYFGKIDAGIGNDEFYKGQAMFNRFKGKQKFSFYGTSSNTGKTGLGWQDSERFGGSNDNVQFIDGGMYISGGGGDEIGGSGGTYYGEGLPIAHNAGVHYDSKWNKDKESINTNYKIGSLDVDLIKNTKTQKDLPKTATQDASVINTTTDEEAERHNFRQKVDVSYSIKLDTVSTLKITADGTLKNNTNKGDIRENSLRNGEQQYTTRRLTDNKGNETLFNISAFYTRKFKKTGRNLSLTLSESNSDRHGEGYLNSTSIFATETVPRTELVNQFNVSNIKTNTFNSNLTFTEPLSKKISLVTNYGINILDAKSDRRTFDQSAPGVYDNLNSTFSNEFDANQFAHQAGAIFSYKGVKTSITAGTKMNAIAFDQYDAYKGETFKRSFMNWMPQLRYQYRMSQYRSFSVGYNGYTNQPSVTQLQTVRVNDDPLNQVDGNANLKPAFSSSIYANYNSYKVLSNESIWASGSIGFTENQITSRVTTNTDGKSLFVPINLTEKTPFNYNLYLDYGRKIKAWDLNIGTSINTYGSQSYSYINDALNKTITNSISGSLNLYKSKEKKYDSRISGGPTYSINKTSTGDSNSSGWGANGNVYFQIFLPAKFNITSEGEYTLIARTAVYDEVNSQFIVNTSLNKTFFKSDNLKLSLSGNDLLNQNRGFRRSANANTITQTTYNNIKRYFMFSLTWDFNKMGGTPAKK